MIMRLLRYKFRNSIETKVTPPMPRIAVVGNCQAGSIADAMRFMLPNSFVKTVYSWITDWYEDEQAFVSDMNSFDFIFAHDTNISGTSIACFSDFKSRVPDAIHIPSIVFPAFHPDLVYASANTDNSSAHILTPLGPYNSAIALLAYQLNLNVRQALALFDEDVYERLGYFDLWADSQAALLQSGQECGIKLDEAFSRWARRGCFMHSINHARMEPLADLAILLLKKNDISIETDYFDGYLADPAQLDAIWPLYPPIAERFGLQGNYMFKRPDYAANGDSKFLTLEMFVQESFKSFAFTPVKKMSCDRVDAWMKDKPLIGWIEAFAKKKVRS